MSISVNKSQYKAISAKNGINDVRLA